jgi:hypothetical protein
MRVYIVGLLPLVVELASITLLLRQGNFVMWLNAAALVFAVPVSWVAAQHFGLAGAAAGSVVAIYADRILTLRHIARLSGVSLRRLQDWRTLLGLMVYAVAAAVVTWVLSTHFLTTTAPIVKLLVGGTLLGALYVALLGVTSIRHSFVVAEKH